jgi:hypothetical protein
MICASTRAAALLKVDEELDLEQRGARDEPELGLCDFERSAPQIAR